MTQKKFKTGLVIGRFYPPHKGHSFLIETALAETQTLAVIVCEKKGQTISADIRAGWIKVMHPAVDVFVARDIVKDGDSAGWAAYVKEILGYTPEALFTSESYGDAYAKELGSAHVLVDKDRTYVPVSATAIWESPLKFLGYLNPTVQEYFLKENKNPAVRGVVYEGTHAAAHLGFPTANIPLVDTSLSGIYAGRVYIGDTSYNAALYADQKRKVLEAHLFDFSGTLYGREITIELLEKVREDQVFIDTETQEKTIANDIKIIREFFQTT